MSSSPEPSTQASAGSRPSLSARRNRPPRLATLVLLVALATAGCAGDDDTAATDTGPETSEVETPGTGEGADSDRVGTAATPATGNESAAAEQAYPDVVDAAAVQSPDGTWRFDVTISSPYDSPERYADAWRVLSPDGTELGVRVLTHDHANEQPFTRSLSGVDVPDAMETVTIEGRDLANGWGGGTLELDLPR